MNRPLTAIKRATALQRHMPPRRKPRPGPGAWLVIMLKVPVAGRVKTRLARGIGTAAATRFYRHAANTLIARLARGTPWTTVLAIAPDHELTSPAFPADMARRPQGPGDLGDRLQRLFDTLPPGPAAIIGTDVPAITPRHIAEAFRALRSHDAVIGPSSDGGYWLIGLKRRPRRRRIFANVRWSSAHARTDTLGNLKDANVGVLAALDDIDEAADYLAHRPRLGRFIP